MKNLALIKLLDELGLVPKAELEHALERSEKRGTSLIQELDELGLIEECLLAKLLADRTGLPMLPSLCAEECMAQALDESIATAIGGVAVGQKNGSLVIALSNPLATCPIELKRMVGRDVTMVVAPESEVRASLHRLYGVGLHHPGIYRAILEESMNSEAQINAEETATRIVHALLVDAIQVDGDIHIMQTKHGWRACLCVGDETHELCHLSPSLYIAVADYLKSLLADQGAESGEFLIKLSDLEFVSFFLDIDRDYSGEQLFLAMLEHRILNPDTTRVDVKIELPESVHQDYARVSRDTQVTVGELIEHAWKLTRDVVDTPCICPYVDRNERLVSSTVSLSAECADEMEVAALRAGRSIEWVVQKVLLMSRECVIRYAP